MNGQSQATSGRLRWGQWLAMDVKPRFTTAMSAVWRVRREREPDGDVFALKTLRFRKGTESTAYLRFEREIRILTSLEARSGIVEVVDHSLATSGDEDSLYYVMPWADTSLDRASKALRGQLEQVLTIGIKIADALGIAHEAGIIHRDVKPANVLLYGDEREPRVADFGIGFLTEEDRLTKVDAHTVGTDEFVAPELRGGGQSEHVSPPVDVYSLGKTLYAAVAGGTVLPREWLDDPRFDLTQQLSDHRLEHLKGLLRRMVAERPEDRYQTMLECRSQLERAVANLREGTRYSPDMYGGADSPVERFVRLSRELTAFADHRRDDAVQDALTKALTAARALSTEVASTSGALAGPVHQPRPEGKKAAERGAEELLAVGVPLIQQNDLAGLGEWLSNLVQMIRSRDDAESSGERFVLPPTVALAVHGAGALAWHRRRLKALRQLVDAQLISPGNWIHHYVLGEGAASVLPWTQEALARSKVLQRADNTLLSNLDSSLSAVAGLVILRGVIAIPAEHLQSWFDSNQQLAPVNAFPGLYYPAAQWASDLPRRFLANTAFEREVALEMFGTTPEGMRAECRRISPALARIIATVARSQDRNTMWVRRVFGTDWSKWCGDSPH